MFVLRLTQQKRVPPAIKCTHLKRFVHLSNNSLIKNNSNTTSSPVNEKIKELPDLKQFLRNQPGTVLKEVHHKKENIPYIKPFELNGENKKIYLDVYGCQMNVNDTEIVWSILKNYKFQRTDKLETADVVLVMTCSIREGAEQKIWNKLDYLSSLKKKRKRLGQDLRIGILGCMAERLKHKLLEKQKSVDLIAGPDSYKDLPRLLAITYDNQTAINVILSLDETYADIMPVRLNEDSVSAYVSIMRGCDNMCTYCIVPFTRGRERSRPISSIVEEIKHLSSQGVKEVTLLGQNVNSYRDTTETNFAVEDLTSLSPTNLAEGFNTVYRNKLGGLRFADLLDKVSEVDPEIRIRFTSPHPKDFPDEVLQVINDKNNICKNIHLPAQSGNDRILDRMRRGYTRDAYLKLVDHVRHIIPNVALSSDFICGFCGETDEEFEDTITLIEQVRYNTLYLFPYSMREKTAAHRKYQDDVPTEVKKRRLMKMIEIYRSDVELINKQMIGQHHLVLVEGPSKRSKYYLSGRNDMNIKVIFPNVEIQAINSQNNEATQIRPGDYIVVQINKATSQCLKGTPLYQTTLTDWSIANNAGYKLYQRNHV